MSTELNLKEVKGFPKIKISDCGGVYKETKNGIVQCKVYTSKYGYRLLTVYNEGSRKTFHVHRLVCENFTDYTSGPIIHLDGDRSNNHVSNLYYTGINKVKEDQVN